MTTTNATTNATHTATSLPLTLVTGATGKTGRRIVERLQAQGLPVRRGSRSASPRFDWHDESSWSAALQNVERVYLAYAPDLAIPGTPELIAKFVQVAEESGVRRVVLLSGRGEPAAQACERTVLASGMEATVVRASWFAQNFSEGHFAESILSGVLPVVASDVGEAFVHADDIADVAVAALTEDGHAGEIYEVTGPELIRMADAVAAIAQESGRTIQYLPMDAASYEGLLAEHGVPAEMAAFYAWLMTTTLDGRNAYTTDGVRRALGREPRSFGEYVRETAESGVWEVA